MLKKALTVGMLLTGASVWGAWNAPVQVSSLESDQVAIVVDPLGYATAVWQGFNGTDYQIRASRRLLSLGGLGSWSSPVTISDGSVSFAQGPVLGADYLGNVVVVWSAFNAELSIIQTASCTSLGVWSSPSTISTLDFNASLPRLAVNRLGVLGNAVAVWQHYNGSYFEVKAAERSLAGAWSSPESLSQTEGDDLLPCIAIEDSGDAIAAYIFNNYLGSYTAWVCSKAAGQAWQALHQVSDGDDQVHSTSVALDAVGRAVMVWGDFNGLNFEIDAIARDAQGVWSDPVAISSPSTESYAPSVQIDTLGTATVLWTAFDGAHYLLQSATCSAGGSWTTPVTLSGGQSDVGDNHFVIAADNTVIAVWSEDNGSNSAIYSSRCPSGGAWSAPVKISNTSSYAYSPSLGVDGTGRAAAVWLQYDGSNHLVWGATAPAGG